MIHLDANASTAMLPEVLEAMMPWLKGDCANPSGAYAAARAARGAMERARAQVAEWLGAEADEIVFTSGGTEGANTAVHAMDRLVGHGHALVSAIEHSAVMQSAAALGRPVKYAPVLEDGRLDLGGYAALLDGAAMVSVMAANNETGVVQPIREVCRMARERGIPVHTDAVQAAGKMPVDARAWGVDFLSVSGHKFHGPRGIGALYVRRGLRFFPLIHGGSQESGRRAGTENTAAIVGLGAAAAAMQRLAGQHARVRTMRDQFESYLVQALPGVRINGHRDERLGNTSHLSFAGCGAVELIQLLDQAGVTCSAGSSCMSGKIRPSQVQLAMGFDNARGLSSLRFSFSLLNTAEEAMAAAEIVRRSVERLRQSGTAGVPGVSSSPCGLATA